MQKNSGVKSLVIPWYIKKHIKHPSKDANQIDQLCMALERDNMPCPMSVSPEQWVRKSFSYICNEYYRYHPRPEKFNPLKPKKKKKAKPHGKSMPANKVFVNNTDVTSDDFLSTYDWRKLRMMALKKYSPKCMCCGATPATGAVINVDHIKPRKLFPHLALDINNLQILCHTCNHGKGNWDRTDWRVRI